MIRVLARATPGPRQGFVTTTIERRKVGPRDVRIAVEYAGICHSDIHHAYNDHGRTIYPLIPGHEIAGVVAEVGVEVTRFAAGDRVGVGCMIDSCGQCRHCQVGNEQYCSEGYVPTAASVDRDGRPTDGGYSEQIVVTDRFVVRIPDAIPLHRAAPLLCAGITLYSPMRHWSVGPHTRLAIVGFGGLGHLGVQFARTFGATVTVIDLSLDKRDDGLALGADAYVTTHDSQALDAMTESFDVVLSTVPVLLDLDMYLNMLDVNGTMVMIGAPDGDLELSPFSLLRKRRSVAGTAIGGTRELQDMLDLCGDHGIAAEVEVIDAGHIDAAYERVLRGDVRYRFVIDIATMSDRPQVGQPCTT